MAETVSFDIDEIPFSHRGAWFGISRVIGLHEYAADLHLVSHQTGMHPVLSLVPTLHGSRVEARVEAASDVLSWVSELGRVSVVFDGPEAIRVRGGGLGLTITAAAGRLTPFTGYYLFRHPADESAVLTAYETGRRYRITPLRGSFKVLGAEALGQAERSVTAGADGGEWEIAVEELESERDPYRQTAGFDAVREACAAEFSDYLESIAPWRTQQTSAAAKAAYVLWSATVRPLGFLGRESVLMSKHWMDKVWSWDHCFNAMALAPADPRAAIDQFLVVFDHQTASGALPDSITHSEVLYNFVKPPIHGWAWSRIRERLAEVPSDETLRSVHRVLAAWSRYWLDSRRVPGHDLPYYEHGNDSGWDNASIFDRERIIESPDLAAFLMMQVEVVADLADELGTGDAAAWRAEAAALRLALLERLWDGERFLARGVRSGRTTHALSLITTLPILAAVRLPAEVNEHLIASVANHLTAWGLATERVDSPQYESDGYWRGPIWAPSTVIVEDGLRAAGAVDVAASVSERFLHLCEASGFAENFDALTGEGLRDRAYTWTASAYLLLAERSVEHAAGPVTPSG